MSGSSRDASLISEVDIEAWYLRYGESVYRRCLRLCRHPQQAQDVAQEVFLRAHKYRESYRGDASPLTWLFSLTDRCCFDVLKKQRAFPQQELQAFLRSEREGNEGSFVSHDLVAKLLSHSADDVRAIVVHRYFDELDLESIAALLDLNERTVRRKLAQFLEQAEQQLRKDE